MFLIPFAFLWLGYPVDFYGYDWIQKIVEGLVHGMVRVVDVFSVMPLCDDYGIVLASF